MKSRHIQAWIQLFSMFLLFLFPFVNQVSAIATGSSLTVAKVTAGRGQTVEVPVTLNSAGEVRGLQFDLQYDRNMVTVEEITAGKDNPTFTVYGNPTLQLGTKKVTRVMIVHMSRNIPAGEAKEVAILKFKMKDQGPVRTPITLSGVVISNEQANDITSGYSLNDGEIVLNDTEPPTIDYTLDPATPTNQNVTVHIDADGTGSNIVKLKWAKGERDIAYFANAGTEVPPTDPKFIATEPGTYTVYAEDELGNKAVNNQIMISNIDRNPPVIVDIVDGNTYGPLKDGVTWSDENDTTATLNGQPYVKGTPIVTEGCYTLLVTDAADNSTTVNFCVDATPPVVTPTPVTLTPDHPNTNQEVVFICAPDVVEATLNGQPYVCGTPITEEGEYVLIVKDPYGNETVTHFIIDKSAPDVTATPVPAGPTNGPVTIEVEAIDKGNPPTGIEEMKWLPGTKTADDFTHNGTPIVDNQFDVTEGGTYTIYVKDKAGNVTVEVVVINNIDQIDPTITLTPSPTTPTNGNVIVQVNADGTGSEILVLKWAEGEKDADFFRNGGGTDATNQQSVTIQNNGTYTFYAKDAAGNDVVYTITIDNIDRAKPTLTLAKSPIDLTQSGIVVTATLDGTGSPIVAKKWAKGKQEATFFQQAGNTLTNDQFLVTKGLGNGYYTAYAKDAAGNEEVATIYVLIVGDVNQDGAITATDLVPTGNFIVSKQTFSTLQYFVADMNDNQEINVLDWISIANAILTDQP